MSTKNNVSIQHAHLGSAAVLAIQFSGSIKTQPKLTESLLNKRNKALRDGGGREQGRRGGTVAKRGGGGGGGGRRRGREEARRKL